MNVVRYGRMQPLPRNVASGQRGPHLARGTVDGIGFEQQYGAGRLLLQLLRRVDATLGIQSRIYLDSRTDTDHQVRQFEDPLRMFPAGKPVKRVGPEQ